MIKSCDREEKWNASVWLVIPLTSPDRTEKDQTEGGLIVAELGILIMALFEK